MKIGEICNRQVITASKETSARQLASLMAKQHVGSVVITENNAGSQRPIGIVTDRDLALKVIAADLDPDAVTAQDFMANDLVTGYSSSGIAESMRHMRRYGIRRLPIVDHNQTLVGIITVDDLLDVVMSELGELSDTITSGRYKEKLRASAKVS